MADDSKTPARKKRPATKPARKAAGARPNKRARAKEAPAHRAVTVARAARERRARMAQDFKIKLARGIAKEISDRGLTQTEAAEIMADAPSQISLVCTGKLRGFSVERLLVMSMALGTSYSVHASTDVGDRSAKLVLHIK